MKIHFLTSLTVGLLLGTLGCASQDGAAVGSTGDAGGRTEAYGEPLQAGIAAVPVANVMAEPAKYAGQTKRLQGVVTEVCQVKGCWLRLAGSAEAEDGIFVKFTCPVDGRLIPMEAVGQSATVEGEIALTELTVEEARHYAEDSGATAEEIAAITAPQIQVRAKSPGAVVAWND